MSVVVVFVVLLVASMFASMGWLLCGGDGSKKKKTKSVMKNPAKDFFTITVFIQKYYVRIRLRILRI